MSARVHLRRTKAERERMKALDRLLRLQRARASQKEQT